MVGRILWLSLVVACPGCASEAVPVPPPSVVRTSVDAPDVLVTPTDKLWIELSEPADADTLAAGLAIVSGLADADLVTAMERGTITDDLRDRFVPALVAIEAKGDGDGRTIRLQPSRPMAPETLHSLVVTRSLSAGGQRIAKSLVRGFTTAGAGSGAPWWRLEAPRTGAVDVVPNLREAVVTFSRPVSFVDGDSLKVVDDADQPAPVSIAADPMPGRFHIRFDKPLAALSRYRVLALAGILDDEGDAPFALDPPPSFSTGSELRTTPPAIDRLELAASSGCLVARFSTSRPALARLCVDGDCVDEAAMRALHEVSHPLPAGATAGVSLRARDESTAPEGTLGPIAAPASSSRTLTITEVLSHPLGARLAQQFVEIQNRGGSDVELGGLEIHDDAGFDTLPDATLPPGGYALLVPIDFVEDDGLDPAVEQGTVIVRLGDGKIGKNGLRLSGEAVSLVDPDEGPVSKFSTVGLKLAAGQSARRALPCDVSGAYEATPGNRSTPGGP